MAYKGVTSKNEDIYIAEDGHQSLIVYIVTFGNDRFKRKDISFTSGKWIEPPRLYETPDSLFAVITLADNILFIINIGTDDVEITDIDPSVPNSMTIPLQQAEIPQPDPHPPSPPQPPRINISKIDAR